MCLRDTAVGVDAIARHPASATAARTGPHRPLDLGDNTQESFKSRRLAGNAVGTVNTPVVVLSRDLTWLSTMQACKGLSNYFAWVGAPRTAP